MNKILQEVNFYY